MGGATPAPPLACPTALAGIGAGPAAGAELAAQGISQATPGSPGFPPISEAPPSGGTGGLAGELSASAAAPTLEPAPAPQPYISTFGSLPPTLSGSSPQMQAILATNAPYMSKLESIASSATRRAPSPCCLLNATGQRSSQGLCSLSSGRTIATANPPLTFPCCLQDCGEDQRRWLPPASPLICCAGLDEGRGQEARSGWRGRQGSTTCAASPARTSPPQLGRSDPALRLRNPASAKARALPIPAVPPPPHSPPPPTHSTRPDRGDGADRAHCLAGCQVPPAHAHTGGGRARLRLAARALQGRAWMCHWNALQTTCSPCNHCTLRRQALCD